MKNVGITAKCPYCNILISVTLGVKIDEAPHLMTNIFCCEICNKLSLLMLFSHKLDHPIVSELNQETMIDGITTDEDKQAYVDSVTYQILQKDSVKKTFGLADDIIYYDSNGREITQVVGANTVSVEEILAEPIEGLEVSFPEILKVPTDEELGLS